MLACLEEQVNRANETKQANIAHQKQIEQKVKGKFIIDSEIFP